jgi:hypothetical protein
MKVKRRRMSVSYRARPQGHILAWLSFFGTLGYEREFMTVMLREEFVMWSANVDLEVWRITYRVNLQK